MKKIFQAYLQCQMLAFIVVSIAALSINVSHIAVGQKVASLATQKKELAEELQQMESQLSRETSLRTLTPYIVEQNYVKITRPTASLSDSIVVASR